MKLAIYGVSRSGKDYLITDLIEYLVDRNINMYHVKGSQTLNNISMRKFNRNFSILSEIEKMICRKEFVSQLFQLEQQYENIVVDGHYAFFDKDMNLYDVFTEDDLNCYDQFFYLDTASESIIQRMRLSCNEKKNDVYSYDNISAWKEHEINGLTYALIKKGKELHILNNYNIKTLEYISEVMLGKYSSLDIAQKLVESIDTLDDYDSVVLVDCDKTLSVEDSTELALKSKGLSGLALKNIYQRDRYSNYQAMLAKEYLKQMKIFSPDSISYIKENISMNTELIQDLKTQKNSLIIGITAGNSCVWKQLLSNVGLNITILEAEMIMSKYIKLYVVRQFQILGKYVISIGDSMLDALMLEYSNKSFIVSNKGYRNNIYTLLSRHRNIHQLLYNRIRYEGVIVEEKINSIKCLDSNKDSIEKNILICKSDSGVEGRKLRKAHYFLGKEVAKMIHSDFPNSTYVVVIMMRSGLIFGQGVADQLDCPELFYDESSIENFQRIFLEGNKYKNCKIILCDGVINSGKTIKEIITFIKGYSILVATNVISSKFNATNLYPIYATRISGNTFVGAKQKVISNGMGPDTSDRLFKTM